jgi:hypothetical protein
VEDEAVRKRNYDTALKEYFWIEDQIDRFDERTLKIKAWSVTLGAATIGAAAASKQPSLFLLASLAALVFWYVEAMWKYFQEALTPRVKFIEDYLNGVHDTYTGPGICKAFSDHFKWPVEKKVFPRLFRLRNVNLPHSLVVVLGIALYILTRFGYISG